MLFNLTDAIGFMSGFLNQGYKAVGLHSIRGFTAWQNACLPLTGGHLSTPADCETQMRWEPHHSDQVYRLIACAVFVAVIAFAFLYLWYLP